MASNHEETDGIVQWPYSVESRLIRYLRKDAKKGLKTSNLGKITWIPIDAAAFSTFRKKHITPKLALKYDCLRKSYREFLKSLSHAGVGFNHTTKTIYVADNVWDGYLKGNQLEVVDVDVEMESEESGETPTQCPKKEPQSSQHCDLDAALDTWTNTLTQNSDGNSNDSQSLVSTATSAEKYSVSQCMAKLNSIVGLDSPSYVRVCRKFVTYEWRVMFMLMTEDNIRCLGGTPPTP